MPRIRHKRGGVFPSVQSSNDLNKERGIVRARATLCEGGEALSSWRRRKKMALIYTPSASSAIPGAWCGRLFSRHPRRDMAGYGGIWRDMAGYREIPGDTGRYQEIRDTGRDGQIRADTGRYGEMRGDARRYGEIQSDIGEIHQDTAKKPSTLGLHSSMYHDRAGRTDDTTETRPFRAFERDLRGGRHGLYGSDWTPLGPF